MPAISIVLEYIAVLLCIVGFYSTAVSAIRLCFGSRYRHRWLWSPSTESDANILLVFGSVVFGMGICLLLVLRVL